RRAAQALRVVGVRRWAGREHGRELGDGARTRGAGGAESGRSVGARVAPRLADVAQHAAEVFGRLDAVGPRIFEGDHPAVLHWTRSRRRATVDAWIPNPRPFL